MNDISAIKLYNKDISAIRDKKLLLLLGAAQRPQPVVYDGANADILENLIGRTLRSMSQK